jgi:hypothetical protein
VLLTAFLAEISFHTLREYQERLSPHAVSMDSGAQVPHFESQLCHVLAVTL